MHEIDLQRLAQEIENVSDSVDLIVYEKRNDPLSQEIKQFAQAVSALFPERITVSELSNTLPLADLPGLTIASGRRRNIHYASIPEQHEIPPFAYALSLAAKGKVVLPPATAELVKHVTSPAEIMVFVSPFCSNCPLVVEAVIGLAMANQLLSVYIIDVQHFTHLAKQYGVQSVPATIIDRHFVHIGEITQERLAEILQHRGTAAYKRDFMRSLIDRGKIDGAADLLCREKDADGMLRLFEEGDLSMRMGVLVVFEEALERDREAIQEMVPKLITMLTNKDPRIRGDIADLLGKVGDPRALPHLERLTRDPDPDVADAATEALDLTQEAQRERTKGNG